MRKFVKNFRKKMKLFLGDERIRREKWPLKRFVTQDKSTICVRNPSFPDRSLRKVVDFGAGRMQVDATREG